MQAQRTDDDTDALEAGNRTASGEFSRANLEAIFRWKTSGRGISRLRRNSDDEIRDALRLAVDAQTERAAVAVLCGLFGVAIPVASAILTAVYPERYTIIDFRALESLGARSSWHTVDSYLAYLEQCRQLARQNTVSLRELEPRPLAAVMGTKLIVVCIERRAARSTWRVCRLVEVPVSGAWPVITRV